MIRVPKVEMHLAHSCNLRCQGCSHYSDYGFQGLVAFAEGGEWLSKWGRRIEPLRFTFLGGEPLLNREIPEYLKLGRELWPHALLRLATNGLLLPRWNGRLWPVLADTRTVLSISVHSRDPGYRQRLDPILEDARHSASRFGFPFEVRDSVDNWYRLYRGHGATMTPFQDGNPARSWSVCQNRHCVTLQDNALWKCPPVAHFPRLDGKFSLPVLRGWKAVREYHPLTLGATDDEIRGFFARRDEPVCGMCPARLEYFEKEIF
jgi:organic radical activating enzyme